MDRLRFLTAGVVLWIGLSATAQAVESLEDEQLDTLHLLGLDTPAAGLLRSPVYGAVSAQTWDKVSDPVENTTARQDSDRPSLDGDEALIRASDGGGLELSLQSLGGNFEFNPLQGSSASPDTAAGVFRVENLRTDSQLVVNPR